jgi:hypothetical protein
MCAYKQLGKGPRCLLVSKRIDERPVRFIKPSRF